MMIVHKHSQRLTKHYTAKRLNAAEIERYVANKMKKFEQSTTENYYEHCRFLVDNVNVERMASGPAKILDLGGGTGELALVLRNTGADVDMVEIYEDELKIAQRLFHDNKIDTSSLTTQIPNIKYDLVTMFSVLEHMDDNIFGEILTKLSQNNCEKIYILVPNMYKIIDDHTGLAFLGLLNRKIVHFILKVLNVKYHLSATGEWDVWYRSVRQIERIALSKGYALQMLDSHRVFPSVDLVPTIDKSPSSLPLLKKMKRIYGMIITACDERNKYPFLNFYLIKK